MSENAFSVKISGDEPISELKDAIKAKKQNDFAGIDADRFKLWKVSIPGDQDNQLRNLIFQDSDELLAIRKLSKYFPDSPPKECIHVLVELPETTTTLSREQELLDQVTLLQALLNNPHMVRMVKERVENFVEPRLIIACFCRVRYHR